MNDVIKQLRELHTELVFGGAAEALTPVAAHHYLIAVSLVEQSIQHMQLADLEQTRELARGRV